MARKQTILIVEDDEDLRRLFRTALTLAGYDVQEAGDGLEALHKIDHAPPDLVVLDIMLPQISGLVVKQEIAAHTVTRDIPIVIITGSTIDLGNAGAACILRKPISPDQLIATVKSCLASGARGV
jgi:DNA-binding response OmpR family regulator